MLEATEREIDPGGQINPTALPWRSDIARWPIEDRERWGRLANDLADQGIPWPEHEAEAYRRVSGSDQMPTVPTRVERDLPVPAWVDDPTLTVSMAQVRASLDRDMRG